MNPLDRAAEIKELFRAHARPEFPDYFDRAYPLAAAQGARSWIGLDERGAVVMHSACFRRRFDLNGSVVVGGLLVNLMVAAAHRTFFPAVKLLARVLADTKREGAIDFLYADPNDEGRAVSLAGGFAAVAHLNRYVLPVSASKRPTDLAIRAFHGALRWVGPGGRVGLVAHRAADFDPAPYEHPPGRSMRLRPYRPPTLFAERLAGYPRDDDHWLAFHCGNGTDRPDGLLLLRGPDVNGRVTLQSLWRAPDLSLRAIVAPLASWLRGVGARRLQATALEESPLGRELTRAGFVPRTDRVPLLALALSERGRRALDAAPAWDLSELDCDR